LIPEALFNCVHILPIGHGLVSGLYLSSLTREKFLVVSDLNSISLLGLGNEATPVKKVT
jgi:hypothetical protein